MEVKASIFLSKSTFGSPLVHQLLTVTFSSHDCKMDKALNQLTDAFLMSVKKFQPFLNVRNLDIDGEE